MADGRIMPLTLHIPTGTSIEGAGEGGHEEDDKGQDGGKDEGGLELSNNNAAGDADDEKLEKEKEDDVEFSPIFIVSDLVDNGGNQEWENHGAGGRDSELKRDDGGKQPGRAAFNQGSGGGNQKFGSEGEEFDFVVHQAGEDEEEEDGNEQGGKGKKPEEEEMFGGNHLRLNNSVSRETVRVKVIFGGRLVGMRKGARRGSVGWRRRARGRGFRG